MNCIAVEMVQYDISGDSLYVTLQQTGDSLGAFSQFKLLLYKGDTIVYTKETYFKKNRQGFSVIQLPRGIAPFLSIDKNKCLQTCVWRDMIDV